MNNIEFMEQSVDFQTLDELFENNTITSTESAKKFEQRNKSSFLIILVSGSLLLMSPTEQVKADPISFLHPTENMDAFLREYNCFVENPISGYIEEVNSITQKQKYSKESIIKEILSFKALHNNWNGYGAYPLEIESATNAILLVDLIGESLFSTVEEIYPNPNGTISFEWKNKSNEILSLEVGNNQMSYYLSLSSQDPIFCNNKLVNAEEAQKISNKIKLL